jgi:4-carboxymuconolactone decarboxylase
MRDGPDAPRIVALPRDGAEDTRLNIFRTLGRNPALYKAFLSLGGHLLRGDSLPAREREIVILRVGWRAGSEYEFGQHTLIGATTGLDDDEIARLAHADVAGWSQDDRALLQMVDELCTDDCVSDTTWESLSSRWSDDELLELLVLAGFYRLVSGMLNSAGVALEPTTPGWPESAVVTRRAPREQQ